MKERPIIFNSDMVRAILDGRKTQTRRIVKPQPTVEIKYREYLAVVDGKKIKCPYGAPGDRLWVREAFCVVDDREFSGDVDEAPEGAVWVDYRATPRYAPPDVAYPAGWENDPIDAEHLTWRPSIHMPRWASRITLEITNVRVERLQEISEEDCLAEGMRPFDPTSKLDQVFSDLTPQDKFSALWDSINGKRAPWESNPWCWVTEFKKV